MMRQAKAYDAKEKVIEPKDNMSGTGKLTRESNMDLEQYSLDELQDFMQTEEYDQLDELSKKTLGNYVNRSLNDVRNSNQANVRWDKQAETRKLSDEEKSWAAENKRKAKTREAGVRGAVKRLTKESIESLGLLVQSIQEGNASDMNQLFDKVMLEKIADLVEQRKQEIAEDLFSEEQIDELSGATLGSYIQKARADRSKKYEHERELDASPKVKALQDKLHDYHNRREYTKTGESKYAKQIGKIRTNIPAEKKKLDPSYPKSGIQGANKRGRGIDSALKKLTSGKLTD